MEPLSSLVRTLDDFFQIESSEPDPSFSRYFPAVMDEAGIDWKRYVESKFAELFNGLLLKGAEKVHTVFASVLPSPDVLDRFFAEADRGDLLFLHHPLDIEMGDPRGKFGRGFLPVSQEHLDKITQRELSIYSCHAPLDVNPEVGTTSAIVASLGAQTKGAFWPYGAGFAGAIATIEATSTEELAARLQDIFTIPYLDLDGQSHETITTIAVVAGAGYKVEHMSEAEQAGAQAFITGEIHDRIKDDYGRRLFEASTAFAKDTSMSLMGVSHSASEFLVMATELPAWLEQNAKVKVKPLPPEQWWR